MCVGEWEGVGLMEMRKDAGVCATKRRGSFRGMLLCVGTYVLSDEVVDFSDASSTIPEQ